MDPLLAQLMEAVFKSQEDWEKALNQAGARINSQLAAEAHEAFKQAAARQNADEAAALAAVASRLWLRLGQRYKALDDYLNYQQILYMAAATEAEYDRVTKGAADIVRMSDEIKADDLAFAAATLAANACYFAYELGGPQAGRWLLEALDYLLLASGRAQNANNMLKFQDFVSLVSAFVEAMTDKYPDPDPDVTAKLSRLAADVERAVPVDFSFSDQFPDSAQKTLVTAKDLALLSYRFGDRGIAQQRLAAGQPK